MLSLLGLDRDYRTVRRQVRNGEPPESRAAFRELQSRYWPRWRIWMVLVSAYRVERMLSVAEGRALSLDRYRKLLLSVGDYPDGFSIQDAREVLAEES